MSYASRSHTGQARSAAYRPTREGGYGSLLSSSINAACARFWKKRGVEPKSLREWNALNLAAKRGAKP